MEFGRYRVVQQIGEGGFGVIYEGFDPMIERHVAIKTCTSPDKGIRERFLREAKVVGRLDHRNITVVFDCDLRHGVPYLVQEYLGGEDLDRKIRRREPLTLATKIGYLRQVARGLGHAHSRGVVHRDVKPSNVRVLDDGTVKIMDFGIAKLAQSDTGLTGNDEILGTICYLSPEQINDDAIDHRTDIFSFGALSYELLTYERAFKGDQDKVILHRIVSEEPPPMSRLWPDCPPQLVTMVERCLRKSPAERYQSCRELLAALDYEPEGQLSETTADPARHPTPAPSPARDKAPAVPTQTPPEATPRPAAVDDSQRTQRSGIDQVHLKTGATARPPASSPSLPAPVPQRRPWLLASGVGVLTLALGALAGWSWLQASRAQDSTSASPAEGQEAPVSAPTLGGSAVKPVTAGPAGPRRSGTEPGGPVPTGTDTPRSADLRSTPPPAPAPLRATLILPAAWDSAMTVSIDDGEPRRLDRRRSQELPPGRHQLRFELATPDYRVPPATVAVDLRAGERKTVPSPIPPPARLTVRQSRGAKRASISLDGRLLGESPIQAQRVPPGTYRLTIYRNGDDTGPLLREEFVTLASNYELTVTFDLYHQHLSTSRKALNP